MALVVFEPNYSAIFVGNGISVHAVSYTTPALESCIAQIKSIDFRQNLILVKSIKINAKSMQINYCYYCYYKTMHTHTTHIFCCCVCMVYFGVPPGFRFPRFCILYHRIAHTRVGIIQDPHSVIMQDPVPYRLRSRTSLGYRRISSYSILRNTMIYYMML